MPQKRTWNVIFHGVESTSSTTSTDNFLESNVIISTTGENGGKEISYDKEISSLRCTIETNNPSQEIRILLKNIQETENDIVIRCFEFLNQAEIEFVLKDILYQMIRTSKDKLILLSQLQAMELEQELLGVLTEIITA